MKHKELAILLSTYNGEKYISEMLDSLMKSPHADGFRIYIRDDGSTDRTATIIKEYASTYPDRFVLFYGENIGSIKSFEYLLKKSLDDECQYFMFADQDDVWTKDKIGLTIEKLEMTNPDQPTLVHSDLYVVNEQLAVIDPSFWNYQNINPNRIELNRLLLQNVITGCTIGINRKLALLSYPFPEQAIMHDWWLALVASAFGKIEVISKQLVYYRQHSTNTIGAKKFAFQIKKIKEPFNISKYTSQAETFYKKYSHMMNDEQLKLLNSFIKLYAVKKIIATRLIIRHSFYKSGIVRSIGLILKLWFQKRV